MFPRRSRWLLLALVSCATYALAGTFGGGGFNAGTPPINGGSISPTQVTAVTVIADGGIFATESVNTLRAEVFDAGSAFVANGFGVGGTANLNGQTNLNSTTVLAVGQAFAPGGVAGFWGSVPTISAGFGTSPSISSNAGTLSFTVNVGTGGTATNGAIGFPQSCSHGYTCECFDITQANNSPNITQQVTPFSANTCTVANKVMSTGALVAWGVSDNLTCTATCH